MKMTPQYANVIGGRLASLLVENAKAIEDAFKSHGENLKISGAISLTVRETISGQTNRAGVAISFDPFPKDKPPEKVKDGVAFDFEPNQLKMFDEERGKNERYQA